MNKCECATFRSLRKTPGFLVTSVHPAFTQGVSGRKKVLVGIHMVGKFVGRQNDLQRLDMLLKGPNNFITIHGFGGIGKTALALQVAKRFDAGKVLAVPLVGNPQLSNVIRKFARFLNVEVENLPNPDQEEVVMERLSNEGMVLLYLDNMEDVKHALDQGSKDAKSLMRFFR